MFWEDHQKEGEGIKLDLTLMSSMLLFTKDSLVDRSRMRLNVRAIDNENGACWSSFWGSRLGDGALLTLKLSHLDPKPKYKRIASMVKWFVIPRRHRKFAYLAKWTETNFSTTLRSTGSYGRKSREAKGFPRPLISTSIWEEASSVFHLKTMLTETRVAWGRTTRGKGRVDVKVTSSW